MKKFNIKNIKYILYNKKNILQEILKLIKQNKLIKINKKVFNLKKKSNLIIKYKNSKKYIIKYNETIKFKISKSSLHYPIRQSFKLTNLGLIPYEKKNISKKAFVLTHLGLGDLINMIGFTRYLLNIYKKIVVVCKNHQLEEMKKFYSDCDKIELYPVISDYEISPIYGCSHQKFYEVTNGFDIYMCGSHIKNCNSCNIGNEFIIPFSFYFDFGLDYNVFWDYFKIPYESFNQLKCDIPYIFINNKSSSGDVFSIQQLKLNNDILIINPLINLYDKSNKYYDIAQKYIGHNMIHYVELIINAKEIYLSNSSMFCLATNLDIKTDKCYYISRDNMSHDLTWSKYYPTNPNKKIKIFKHIIF